MNYYYFKNSFAALLALSAPEPPPFVLLLLDDLPLDPFFFEVSPAFSSTNFLASFPIFSAIRANHTPFPSGEVDTRVSTPTGIILTPTAKRAEALEGTPAYS
jgi:hypothetical protein